MQFHFRYSKPAVINGLRFHFLRRNETKLFRVVLTVLLVLGVVGYGLRVVSFSVVVALLCMFLLLILAFWYILPLSIYRKAATFREPDIRLNCTEEGISIGTGAGDRHLRWSSFHEVVETGDFFYLYRDNKSFFLIPTDAFTDEEEKKEFSDLLRRQFSHYSVK